MSNIFGGFLIRHAFTLAGCKAWQPFMLDVRVNSTKCMLDAFFRASSLL